MVKGGILYSSTHITGLRRGTEKGLKEYLKKCPYLNPFIIERLEEILPVVGRLPSESSVSETERNGRQNLA